MNRRDFFRGAAAVAASPALLGGGVVGFLVGQYGPPKAAPAMMVWRTTVNMEEMTRQYHAGLIAQTWVLSGEKGPCTWKVG